MPLEIVPKNKNGKKSKGLKTAPEGKEGKGLRSLPTPVRNKMGYMKKGGKTPPVPKSLKEVMNKKYRDRMSDYFYLLGGEEPVSKRKKTMLEKLFGGGPEEERAIKRGRAAKSANKLAISSLKRDFPQAVKRVTTEKKQGGKVMKMRGGGMASRGLNFRVR